jgi:hypothetical protein
MVDELTVNWKETAAARSGLSRALERQRVARYFARQSLEAWKQSAIQINVVLSLVSLIPFLVRFRELSSGFVSFLTRGSRCTSSVYE